MAHDDDIRYIVVVDVEPHWNYCCFFFFILWIWNVFVYNPAYSTRLVNVEWDFSTWNVNSFRFFFVFPCARVRRDSVKSNNSTCHHRFFHQDMNDESTSRQLNKHISHWTKFDMFVSLKRFIYFPDWNWSTDSIQLDSYSICFGCDFLPFDYPIAESLSKQTEQHSENDQKL